jgi:hypothetical protein
MRRTRTLLVTGLLALAAGACVEHVRPSIIQFNIVQGGFDTNAAGEHYALYAEINGGAVALERFKVLDAVTDCGGDPNRIYGPTAGPPPPVKLFQLYRNDQDQAGVCDPDRRIGTEDLLYAEAGLLIGGVRMDVDVDLAEATRVWVSVEPDDDVDPRPSGPPIVTAALGEGADPFIPEAIECLRQFCVEFADLGLPDCETVDARTVPPARRGVLVGTLVPPAGDACLRPDQAVGEIAIVPAEDET